MDDAPGALGLRHRQRSRQRCKANGAETVKAYVLFLNPAIEEIPKVIREMITARSAGVAQESSFNDASLQSELAR